MSCFEILINAYKLVGLRQGIVNLIAAKPFREIIRDGETWMKDREDLKLKAELEEIMKSVDNIMKKVETIMPAKEDETQSQSE